MVNEIGLARGAEGIGEGAGLMTADGGADGGVGGVVVEARAVEVGAILGASGGAIAVTAEVGAELVPVAAACSWFA